MLLNVAACTALQRETVMVDVTGQEAASHFTQGRILFAAGDYEGAMRESEAVLLLAGHHVPLDEALFQIGLILAHPANPARDPERALAAFAKLVRSDLGSARAVEAMGISELIREHERIRAAAERSNRALAEMREEAERSNQAFTGIRQENERLVRTIERLNNVIDELKQVDIDVDQKKRGKGR